MIYGKVVQAKTHARNERGRDEKRRVVNQKFRFVSQALSFIPRNQFV